MCMELELEQEQEDWHAGNQDGRTKTHGPGGAKRG